jgi:hypothetical protein
MNHTHVFTHTCAADTHGHLTDLTPENVEAGGGMGAAPPDFRPCRDRYGGRSDTLFF